MIRGRNRYPGSQGYRGLQTIKEDHMIDYDLDVITNRHCLDSQLDGLLE